jgi:hypothetical protein
VPMATFIDGKSENPAVVFVIKVVIYDSGPSSYISSSGTKRFSIQGSPVHHLSYRSVTAVVNGVQRIFYIKFFCFFFFHLNATVH